MIFVTATLKSLQIYLCKAPLEPQVHSSKGWISSFSFVIRIPAKILLFNFRKISLSGRTKFGEKKCDREIYKHISVERAVSRREYYRLLPLIHTERQLE